MKMSQFRLNFTSAPHIMPSPPTIPWNAEAMPWTTSAPYPRVMEFNATSTPSLTNQISINKTNFNINIQKRKSDIPLPTPSKQFITEEKMAAHLNGLHISPDYISHDINQTTLNTNQYTNSISDISMDLDTAANNDYFLPLTAKDLEEKLKNASKITVCDALKRFNEEDAIVPKALLSRIENPCTALVLWQPPPQKIKDLMKKNQKNEFNVFGASSSCNSAPNNDGFEDDEIEDQQNNSSKLHYNYGMETDM